MKFTKIPLGAILESTTRAVSVLLFVIFYCFGFGCKSSKGDKQERYDRFDSVDQFWSSSANPGLTARSLGFSESNGIYCYWETTDVGPINRGYSLRGRYLKSSKRYELKNPFGESLVLEERVISEVTCLIPENMSLEEARHLGWLLIKRDGASSSHPFARKSDTEFDIFDR